MGGSGFSFKIKMSTAEAKDRAHFFQVDSVHVDVKNLNIKLKKSKFRVVFALFKPLLFRVIRPVIQKVLEKQIKDSVNQLDEMAYAINEEVKRAAADVKNDPANAPNVYNRYYTAAQKKIMQGKEKTAKTTADKKVNIAMTQHDSLFPNVQLPGGISTKATEYKELAAKGDKWESPVFGIGAAKESTGLPKPTAVSRKPHNTAAGMTGVGSTSAPNTSGFKNEVNEAFGGKNQDLSLAQGGNGTAAPPPATQGGTGTYFGANNPVLNGSTGTEKTTLASDVRGAMA
jgi:hypothetical protein